MDVAKLIYRVGFTTTSALLFTGGLWAGPAAADVVEPEGPDCSQAKCIALTFDDGPGEYTDTLLDTLGERGTAATFYLLGSQVGDNTETVQRMADEGHEIGNHTWDHPDLTGLSPEEIQDQVERTDTAITEAVGEDPRTMRPPYGALDEAVLESIDHPLVLWDVDTLDWQSLDPVQVTDAAVGQAFGGSVVLFHDIHASTVEAIPYVLDGLEQKGYEFVTVEQLLDEQDLVPGSVYGDAAPETEEAVPAPDRTVPGTEETVPGPQGAVPAPEGTVPGPEEMAPGTEGTVPAPEDAAPGAEGTAPTW